MRFLAEKRQIAFIDSLVAAEIGLGRNVILELWNDAASFSQVLPSESVSNTHRTGHSFLIRQGLQYGVSCLWPKLLCIH